MAAPEIAVAYVSIVPELRGFARDLRRGLQVTERETESAGQEGGRSFGQAFKGALAAVGIAQAAGAIGAQISQAMTDALDQANVKSTLQAQLGATGKDAGRYGKVAGQLYSKGVTDSFQGAADAIRAVAQAGLVPPGATNAQLASIATKAADLSNVFGQDLAGVTNAVSQMLRTGLAKNAGEAFDILTKGFQNGANKADDLLDTFNEYGTQFRKLGLDGKTALGIISQGVQAGARDSDIAADALKEFSIRAIDGSESTADGFKLLGLSAKDMAGRIAKGGGSASKALDLTLDKLRGIKDPVKQSAAATALFGTQAEDLGKALFAMDPSKAAAGLGKVGGSAKKVGDTIRSGPQYEVQRFTRTLKQGFVNLLGKYVLPAAQSLIDHLDDVGRAIATGFRVFLDVAPWLAPIAILIGGITIALNAQAIATGAVTAVFSIYRAALLVGTAVTNGFAAAQALLNAVMALNPIALVVIALAALGAALFVAWKKSETFRNIVKGAWQAIQVAALYAWNSVLKPTINAFATAAQWLYGNVIKPVFGLIVGVFKFWWSGVKFYFRMAQAIFRALAAVARWLYGTVIKPVFRLIVGAAKQWWTGVKFYFNLARAGFGAVGAVAKWLYNNAIKPAFGWIASRAKWLWNSGVKPWFDKLKKGASLMATAFKVAKDNIGKQWSKLSSIAKKPISFIVNTVYNKGIVGVWNKVATAFGAKKLKTFKFASGGILPGYTPGRDPHKFWSPTGGALELSGGEAIMRPEVTRALGVSTVNRLNGAAKSGGVGAVKSALGGQAFANGGVYQPQRFADGGIFGWAKNALGGAWDKVKKGAAWLKDGVKASALAGLNKLVKPLINQISGNSGLYSKMVKGIPTKMLSSILDYSGKADKALASAGVGGKGTRAALRWARTQNGKRYQWGGNGNPSWDCSGFMSAIESVIRGQKPHRRWSTHAFAGGNAPPGWQRNLRAPFMVGITHSGVGHTAGTLNGVNVESRGGDGVVVGSRARGYNSGLFGSWYGFAPSKKYDAGGWLQPGATMAVNKTGKPEAILTNGQFSTLATLASQGAGGLQPGDKLTLTIDGRTQLEAYVDRRADARIRDGLVAPAALGRAL